ncbi:MAG: acetate/propionate family kinase [Nevskia sp.]|nr:acetate/propionate family kinase [Nevskia sp.]
MREPLLVINAGSSSIKFSLYATLPDRTLAAGVHGQVEKIGADARLAVRDAQGGRLAEGPVAAATHEQAIGAIHRWLSGHIGAERALAGVGHRVVHGGPRLTLPLRVDAEVLRELEALTPLAPLHQPHSIAGIRAIARLAPEVPQVACFDTAFHRSQPELAQRFALPGALTAKGVRRYGFHGLSYESIVAALAERAPALARGRLVVAHLGNGASLCAIRAGRSVASTMGFTPLDGLVMGTRAGALDPGVVLYLLQEEKMDLAAVTEFLYRRCGLLGVSGLSADMRTLLASDAPSAREAVDLFVYRIGRELGSMAAALGGLDGLVFTGGIGEHSAVIRARVAAEARWLGVRLAATANESGAARISAPDSAVAVWVLESDENGVIARHTRRVLDG